MGFFHQLRVRQKLIYKRHDYKGYGNWFVHAGVIAKGSVDATTESRYYYRCTRIHKESFAAFVQFRVEAITDNYVNMDEVIFSRKL